MILTDFKEKIRTKQYYGLKGKMFVNGFKDIYKHSCKVEEIALEIAVQNSFSKSEQAIIQIAAMLHDVCKIHGDNHAIVAATRVRQDENLRCDINSLLSEEYQINHAEEILDFIAFVIENHSRMDRIINNQINEQKCKLALVVYAADKIDKFRKYRKKGKIYSKNDFDEQMNVAYCAISKEYPHMVEDIKPTIQIVMENHR